MSLLPKNISDIIVEVRDTLQDQQKNRWTDQELYRYLDQGMRDIALRTRYDLNTQIINVVSGTTDYSFDKECMELYKHSSAQTIEQVDSTTLRFEDSAEEEVTIEYYAFPARIVYGVDTALSLDEDLYDALKYYILYRGYEKEESTENLQKAIYFKNEYREYLSHHTTRWHGKTKYTLAKQDFLT